MEPDLTETPIGCGLPGVTLTPHQTLELSHYLTQPGFNLLKAVLDGAESCQTANLRTNTTLTDRQMHELQGSLCLLDTLASSLRVVHEAAAFIRSQQPV